MRVEVVATDLDLVLVLEQRRRVNGLDRIRRRVPLESTRTEDRDVGDRDPWRRRVRQIADIDLSVRRQRWTTKVVSTRSVETRAVRALELVKQAAFIGDGGPLHEHRVIFVDEMIRRGRARRERLRLRGIVIGLGAERVRRLDSLVVAQIVVPLPHREVEPEESQHDPDVGRRQSQKRAVFGRNAVVERNVLRRAFVRAEEEALVLLQWAAQAAAPLLAAEIGLRPAKPLLREILFVEVLVAKEPVAAALHLVPTGLRHGVDHAADRAAVLGGAAERDHLEFLNRVLAVARLRHREGLVQIVEAVDEERPLLGPRAANDYPRSLNRRHRLGGRGQQQREIEILAVSARQRFDRVLRDDAAQRGLAAFDERRLAADRHALFNGAEAQREVQIGDRPDVHRHVGPFDRREAGELRGHRVPTRLKRGDAIEAVVERHHRSRLAGREVHHRDGGAGQRCAGLIGDDAGNRAGLFLRRRRRGNAAGDDCQPHGYRQIASLQHRLSHRPLLVAVDFSERYTPARGLRESFSTDHRCAKARACKLERN